MILRSPAENENGGISFHRVPSSTRHSRARGNPGLLRGISLDTRFRGYDGTQAGLLVLIPKRVFSKEDTKSTKFKNKISEAFVIFVVNEIRVIVPGYPYTSLKSRKNKPRVYFRSVHRSQGRNMEKRR